MTDTPSNNDSLMEFPCEFHLKVIGKNSLDFQGLVMTIMRKHVPDLSEGAVKPNNSKQANYLSLTITFQAQSKAQLDDIYRELSSHDEVIMTL